MKNNITGNIRAIILCTILILCVHIGNAITGANTVNLMGRDFHAFKVSKKESLYALSRSLGLNYDSLSTWNQGFNGEVPKGYILYLPAGTASEQKPQVKPINVINYKVKYGDTLYAISHKYNTTVEDIITINPRLRSSVLPADTEIKVPQNSATHQLIPVIEKREGIKYFKYYKVGKDESAEGICRQNHITPALLQMVNPGVQIKRNSIIALPIVGETDFIVYRHNTDKRENTSEGQQAIFDSIANSRQLPTTNVVILLANPQSNKDVDFSRGFLTAVREFGEGSRHIDIKFLKASNETGEIISEPAIKDADLIFTTYDATIPSSLAQYAERTGKTLINAFAVKDSLVNTNSSIINLLSSPREFNAQVAQYIIENFDNSYFVFIGDPLKSQDQIALQVMNGIDPENFEVVATLEQSEPHPFRPMVFYSLANNKKEMKDDLETIEKWMTKYPEVDVNTIGRPSWIVNVDTHSEILKKTHANVPTRFYFGEKDIESNEFLKKYYEFFKSDPIRSYPAYSVMGYDAAWYFLRPGMDHKYLQMPFRLTRIIGGGEYNSAAFMLRYFPGMPVTKFDIIPYFQIDE